MPYEADYRPPLPPASEGGPGYYYNAPPMNMPPESSYYGPPPHGMAEAHGAYHNRMPEMPMHPASPPHMRYAHEPMEYMAMHNGPDLHRPPPPMPEDAMMPMEMGMSLPMGHGGMPEMMPMHHGGPMMPARRGPTSSHRTSSKRGPPSMAEPVSSKRDRKRKEILERLERTHWDDMENRDTIYQETYMGLASTYQALMMRPSMVREYAMEVADKAVNRTATLRANSLYHAFLLERSHHLYQAERGKVEDEARLAKRSTRDKLLAVIEERKRRLREERDGGDFASDFLLESTQRQSTRQLRNKSASVNAPATRLSRLLDDDDAMTGGRQGITQAVAYLLGWSELEVAVTIAAASAEGEDGMLLCKSADGTTTALPLQATLASQTSLLAGVNVNTNVAASKNKKKGAAAKVSAANGSERSGDDEDTSTPLLSSGGGRLRWDTAKCLAQLTSAKDIEIESDLININKIGTKRRRR
ncbi:hypothetical protein ACI68E_002568 [Malassezia pachydermatis]